MLVDAFEGGVSGEDEADSVGATDVEVVADDLLEEDPPADGPQ